MSCPNSNIPSVQSLSERINAATRKTHSQLNRLILERIPHALPPHTSDPSIYVSGLLHIASIYINFEGLWNDILESPKSSSKCSSNGPFSAYYDWGSLSNSVVNPISPNIDMPSPNQIPTVCSRIEYILRLLRIPDLLRAEVIVADIQNLTFLPKHKTLEKIEAVTKAGALFEFLAHTKNSVNENPQVLVAYSWVLYMALFSGGRYLRALLIDAGGSGAKFWSNQFLPNSLHNVLPDTSKSSISQSNINGSTKELVSTPRFSAKYQTSKENLGLQLFHFSGDADGEDLKLEFKKRMLEADSLLTDSEKMDVILEAQNIFKFMIKIVRDLDILMEKQRGVN